MTSILDRAFVYHPAISHTGPVPGQPSFAERMRQRMDAAKEWQEEKGRSWSAPPNSCWSGTLHDDKMIWEKVSPATGAGGGGGGSGIGPYIRIGQID